MALLALVALLFVGRAIVELVTVNPTRPETYRHDWGGPSYAGVVLVHVLPGALSVLLARHCLRRKSQ